MGNKCYHNTIQSILDKGFHTTIMNIFKVIHNILHLHRTKISKMRVQNLCQLKQMGILKIFFLNLSPAFWDNITDVDVYYKSEKPYIKATEKYEIK